MIKKVVSIQVVVIGLSLLLMKGVLAADFDNEIQLSGQTLYLNGEGPRKKAFITLYDTALYLTEKGDDASSIIQADHNMALSLIIESGLVSASRISEAFVEGLEKSTGGDMGSIATETEAFLGVFEQGVSKGDAYQFSYQPDAGTQIIKNGSVEATIAGLAFKQALFGIWLAGDPVSGKLKKQLLGK